MQSVLNRGLKWFFVFKNKNSDRWLYLEYNHIGIVEGNKLKIPLLLSSSFEVVNLDSVALTNILCSTNNK